MRDTPVPKTALDRATRFKIYDPDTGFDGTASLEDFGLITATTGPGGVVEPLTQVGPNLERGRNQQAIDLMRQDFAYRRRGKVGIGQNKAAIALRFDDWQDAMKATVRPLLAARQIPFSLVLISRWQTAVTWGSTATPADLTSWVDYGAEVFCHGLDHQDYIGYKGLYDNVVGAKEEIETLLPTVRVQGFSIPGIDTSYGTAENPSSPVTPDQRGSEYPYDRLSQASDWYGPAGRLLMSHYPLVESDSGPVRLPICAEPSLYMYGRAHVGLDSLTLAQAIAEVDRAIREKCSLRIMGHAGNFGTPGKMTVAEFTTFLDYLVTKRAAGLLEIVMPSSLPFVTNASDRLDLMSGWGRLVGATDTSPSGWFKLGGTYNIVNPTGGHDDLPYCQIDASGQYIYNPSYVVTDATRQGLDGGTFEFRGWAQSVDTNNTSARIDITAGGTSWAVGKTFVVGNALTLVRFQFTIPKVGPAGEFIGTISIKPSRYGGSGVRWSDMSCVKI